MNPNWILVFLSLFMGGVIVTAALMPLARWVALKIGLVDRPGARKVHARIIPYGGGVAMYFAFLLVLGAAYVAATSDLAPGFMAKFRAEVQDYLNGLLLAGTIAKLGALLLGASMMFLLGFFDDRRGMHPRLKIFLQVVAATLLYATGVRITLFVESHGAVSLFFTVVWVVGITNAMNLLDNMDGLSAGVGAIASTILFVVAFQNGQVFVAAVLAVLVGTLLGFLLFNFSPASIFMGDAGALFLGYLLAALSMGGEYYKGEGTFLTVVMPVVILAIPIFDTISVMLIRWKTGAPLMVGDKNHFSHRLVRLGMTTREAVLTIYLLTAALGLSATLLARLDTRGGVLVLFHTGAILLVIGLLERAAHRRRP
ncbi:MAG: MraY family glycosyltransferase [Planctomycetota bacterium]